MKIAVPKEVREYETRVATVPETVKKFRNLGAEVVVQSGAGEGSDLPDRAYEEAGASIAQDFAATLEGAEVVLKVLRPTGEEIGAFGKGQKLFCIMAPWSDRETAEKLAKKGVDVFAMELMPRISRAQSMDVLSSQSNLAGYKAVIEAANAYGRALPQMMTAAGTVAPARVFVMGVGVAGLQAIATAKRLGGVVTATDVRPDTEEQVKSLGGKFVAVKNEEFAQAQTAGGYAREMSDDYKRQQAELVAGHIAKQDIVITTALIPGRKAPVLVSADMVASMKPGAVIVDLAVEQGGNVEGSKVDETVVTGNGVKILGFANMPGRLAADASSLYARNHLNFLTPFIEDGRLTLKEDDELVRGIRLSRDGRMVHPDFGGEAEAEPADAGDGKDATDEGGSDAGAEAREG